MKENYPKNTKTRLMRVEEPPYEFIFSTFWTSADPEREKTFGEYAEQWLRIKKVEIRSSSLRKYRQVLEKYLLPAFQDCPISSITTQSLESFQMELILDFGLAAVTVVQIMTIFKMIFQFAFTSRNLQVPIRKIRTIRVQPRRMRILTRTEQKVLSDFLLANMNPTALAVYLTMTTGMRHGEVCALRWSDISLHEECITVRYSLQRTVSDDSAGAKRTALTLVEPKTASGRRTIPLTPKALELCRRMEADRDIYVGSGTSKPLDPRTLHNRFGQILTQCGLQDVHFHTLRHTFATRCVEESMDIKCISELLGHSSVIITLEKYVHVSLEVKKTSIQRIAQALE